MWRNRKLDQLAEALGWDSGGETIEVPESAVRDLRGNRQQMEIATKSGLSQQMISELERGNRHLTPEVAQKLAPVLGVTPQQLQMAEQVAVLQRAALKGSLDPHRLLDAVMVMAEALPDDEQSDQLVDMLVEVVRKAAMTYGQGEEQEVLEVATKTNATRDDLGRRIDKKFGLKDQQQGTPASLKSEEPRRDPSGRRLDKPFAPRQGRR